jgi:hypothetical protein
MTDDRKAPPDSPEAAAGKKPYARPSVVSEPIYEKLALACGKNPGHGGVCIGAPRRS